MPSNDSKSGVLPSQNAAADVPRSILQERKNARESPANQQRLAPKQEKFLVKWILEDDKRGYPPSHSRARNMAARLLRMKGDTRRLGKRWLRKFIERNPRVALVIGRKIEAKRDDSTTQEAFQEVFAQ